MRVFKKVISVQNGIHKRKRVLSNTNTSLNKQPLIRSDIFFKSLKILNYCNAPEQISDQLGCHSELIFETFGFATMTGKRDQNEDTAAWLQVGDRQFLGVFDGHGGKDCSVYCEDNFDTLPLFIEKYGIKDGLINWFLQLDTYFKIDYPPGKTCLGSTAIVVVLDKDQIVVANAGDCRAVLFGEKGTIDILSNDHNPCPIKTPSEVERVIDVDGQVSHNRVSFQGLPFLAVSRAIRNDHIPGVTAHPEVLFFERSDSDQFMVIASDGLWHTLPCAFIYQKAAPIFEKTRDGLKTAEFLRDLAYQMGSSDNITVIVVPLV